MEVLQQMPQLEAMCERLYTAQVRLSRERSWIGAGSASPRASPRSSTCMAPLVAPLIPLVAA